MPYACLAAAIGDGASVVDAFMPRALRATASNRTLVYRASVPDTSIRPTIVHDRRTGGRAGGDIASRREQRRDDARKRDHSDH